jgi:hypothetical protein
MHELYGGEVAGRTLTTLGRLFTRYLHARGFTCRIDDLLLSVRTQPSAHRSPRLTPCDGRSCWHRALIA